MREYYISLQELCGLGYTFKSKVPIEKLWGIFLCVPEVCPIIGGSFIGIVYCGPCCTSIYRTVPCCSFAQFFAIEKKITCVAGIRSKWRRSWRNYCCCDVMWVYRSFAMRYWQWWQYRCFKPSTLCCYCLKNMAERVPMTLCTPYAYASTRHIFVGIFSWELHSTNTRVNGQL